MYSGLARLPPPLGASTVAVTVTADVSVEDVLLAAVVLPLLVAALATTLPERMIAVTETETGTTTANVVTRAIVLAARTLGTMTLRPLSK